MGRDECIELLGLKFMRGETMSSQNNCATCNHKNHPDGGWCYMFSTEPAGKCRKHPASIVQSLAQQRHKRMTLAVFDMLEHFDKREAMEQRAAVERTLGIRRWTCSCGAEHDRDVNAAKNIARFGLESLAVGAPA